MPQAEVRDGRVGRVRLAAVGGWGPAPMRARAPVLPLAGCRHDVIHVNAFYGRLRPADVLSVALLCYLSPFMGDPEVERPQLADVLSVALLSYLTPGDCMECSCVSHECSKMLAHSDVWAMFHTEAGFGQSTCSTPCRTMRDDFVAAVYGLTTQAIEAIESKQWQRGLTLTNRALRIVPGWCRGWEESVGCLRHLGRWEEAESRAQVALRANVGTADAHVTNRLHACAVAAERERVQWHHTFEALQSFLDTLDREEDGTALINVAGVPLPRSACPPRMVLARRILPMWEHFPQPRYHWGAPGWRTGEGMEFIAHWHDGFSKLTKAQRYRYQEVFPEHRDWTGFYSAAQPART